MTKSLLKQYRESRGLSRDAFARLVGVNSANVYTVETGRRRAWPKLKQDSARVLGVSEKELFPEGGEEK